MLLKRLAEPWNSHQFESAVAQPMIASGERDYPWFPAMQEGGFDRNLNGLKPRITQCCFSHAKSPSLERYLTQFLAYKDLARGGMNVSHRVHQSGRLEGDRRLYGRVGVTVRGNRKAGREIEKAVVVHIPDVDS
jgi:hypothetical protein